MGYLSPEGGKTLQAFFGVGRFWANLGEKNLHLLFNTLLASQVGRYFTDQGTTVLTGWLGGGGRLGGRQGNDLKKAEGYQELHLGSEEYGTSDEIMAGLCIYSLVVMMDAVLGYTLYSSEQQLG